MSKMKRTMVIIIAAIMCFTLMACQNVKPEVTPATPTNPADNTGTDKLLDGGVTNPTGYPIVNQPVTLRAAVTQLSNLGDVSKRKIWKTIEETTGVKIDLEFYADTEKVNLMLASRDYPDITFRLDSTGTAMADAIEAGDLLCLDDYMQYAPTISSFLEEKPEMRNYLKSSDGKVYNFAQIYLDETSYNLRDQWFINKKWLDELNLNIPTTTDEFFSVMKAFKDNAGKGTIPENVVPFYARHAQGICGLYDLYGAFGVYSPTIYPNANFIYVDNKIQLQAVNPLLKNALKFARDMYAEGILQPQMFTDDWNAFISTVSSDPPVVGAFQAYNDYTNLKYFYPMAPFKNTNGDPTYMRRQQKGAAVNFRVFSKCKYPVAAVRVADFMCQPENSMTLAFGSQNVGWKYNDKGEFEVIAGAQFAQADEDGQLGNLVPAITTSEMYKNPNMNTEGTREWAYENLYKQFLPEQVFERPFYVAPTATLEYTTRQQKIADLKKQVDEYVNKMHADWITGTKDIDATWDEYVKNIYNLGAEELMQLLQIDLDEGLAR